MLISDDLPYFVTEKVSSMTILSSSQICFSRCSRGHVDAKEADTCHAAGPKRVSRRDRHVSRRETDTCLPVRLKCVLSRDRHVSRRETDTCLAAGTTRVLLWDRHVSRLETDTSLCGNDTCLAAGSTRVSLWFQHVHFLSDWHVAACVGMPVLTSWRFFIIEIRLIVTENESPVHNNNRHRTHHKLHITNLMFIQLKFPNTWEKLFIQPNFPNTWEAQVQTSLVHKHSVLKQRSQATQPLFKVTLSWGQMSWTAEDLRQDRN